MVVLIFVKWGTHYGNTAFAPSIIQMFLSLGAINGSPLIGTYEFNVWLNHLLFMVAACSAMALFGLKLLCHFGLVKRENKPRVELEMGHKMKIDSDSDSADEESLILPK